MRTQKLALTTVWTLASASGFAQTVTIPAEVVDNYGAPKIVIAAAQKVAAYILANAGVNLDWQQNLTSGGLTLYIVERRTLQGDKDALGYTPTGGGCDCAHLLYRVIEQIAEQLRGGVSTVLGAAMAHEIGHILGVGHSPMGVMSPRFEREHIVKAGTGELRFSAPQASQIRTEIARRKAALTAP